MIHPGAYYEEESISSVLSMKHMLDMGLVSFDYFMQSFVELLKSLDVRRLPWSAIINQIERKLQDYQVVSFKSIQQNFLYERKFRNKNMSEGSICDSEFRRCFPFICEAVLQEYQQQSKCEDSRLILKIKADVTDALPFSSGSSSKTFREDLPASESCPRRLEGMHRVPYSESKFKIDEHTGHQNPAWGQRKLLMNEISFLSTYANPGDTVLYIGSSE
jgi:hypothetical protein